MPEPSVSEILNINADPERGTGEPAVVYDNSQVLSLLNQNARANQENQWRRYNRYLNDYETRLKEAQDISGLEVADSDREYLKGKLTTLLSGALDNPTAIYSPEFNSELSKIKADATSSKLGRNFGEENLKWMAANPEWSTDENKELVLDYLNNQTIEKGGRKPFALNYPDVFDYQKYFSGVKDLNKEMINANRVDEKQELIFQRQDKKFKYDSFIKSVEVGYDSNKEIQKRAQKDFNSLPPELKKQFEDAKDYWVNLSSKYFGSPGFTDIIEQGEEIIKPYNAPGEKSDRALNWAQLKENARKANMDDATRQYIANLNAGEESGSKALPELPVSPLPAIFGTIGKENTLYDVKSLPISQIAAIAPDWIEKDSNGKLTEELTSAAKGYKVSVGKDKDGNYGVYLFNEDGKPLTDGRILNEQKLKSNAESWLASYAKERKGQDVYGTLRPLFEEFKLRDKGVKPAASTTIKSKRKASDGNTYYIGENGRIYSDENATMDVTDKFQ